MRVTRVSLVSCCRAAAVALAVTLLQACGASTSTSTAPSPIARCGVTLGVPDATVSASGGTGRVTITTARECAWTASADVEWLSITGPASGQGDGAVDYRVQPNPDPLVRRGNLRLNDQRAEITQDPGECVLSLRDASADFSQGGGSGSVGVVASSQLCTWSAASEAPWVTIRSGSSGKGTAAVAFDVEPTTGPPRTTTLTIAGQRFTVNQSQGCAYALKPASQEFGASGGGGAAEVATVAGCPWIAASNVSWISVQQTSATSGPGTIRFTVAPTDGPPRTGTLVIAGQVFTVTQSAGCAFQVAPASLSVGASGGGTSVTVTAASGCAWSAASEASWITVTAGASGSGSGTVSLAVAATSGPARSGTVVVAGQRITVSQTQGCAYSIDPTSHNVAAGGGDGTVSVTSASGCAWTASSAVSWIRITEGSSGSGNGTVRYDVSATSGPARSGTLTIAGRTFTVNQGQGCTFSLSSSSATVPAAGGTRSFDVQASGGCGWTASSGVSWISIASGASGEGNGTVRLTIAANEGPERSGTVTAGGRTFTVTQEGGCAVSLGSSSQGVPAGGGPGTVAVTTPGGCAWTAASQAGWITINEGQTGTGPGTVRFTASPNSGAPRSGALLIGGQTFTVNQDGGCAYTIAPEQQAVDPGGGQVTVMVNAAGGCAWTASAAVPWITVTSGASGSGSGSVQLTVAPNTEAARSGTVAIAGRTLTISQGTGCTYAVAPDPVAAAAAGGPVTLQLTTAPTCGWTASSSASWIAVAPPASGTGSGPIQITIEANAGPARAGVLTVGTRGVPVSQDSGCTYTLSAPGQTLPAAGGNGAVTVQAGGGCAWTAASQVPWITVTSGVSGNGTQTIQFTVEPNGTGMARAGTITIALPGQTPLTFTINQEI